LWDHPVSERQQKLCWDIDFSDGLLAIEKQVDDIKRRLSELEKPPKSKQ